MNGRELPIRIKPTLHLTDEDIDIGSNVSVGDKVQIQIDGKVKGISREEIEKNKEVNSYTFEISSASISSGLKKKEGIGEALDGRLVAE